MYIYIHVCIKHLYVGICALVREVGMGVHGAAPPAMHTFVRLRAPTMRPSPSHAHVWVRNTCMVSAGHTRARAASVRARFCACAIGRPCIRADACERVPSVWTAGGSARRRSAVRRRSTRTSARGTPRRCRTCVRYASRFRPGRRGHRRRDALGRVADAARAGVRGGAADARARVRSRVGTRIRGCPRA